jgi:4-hydroxybenzoate polyprenyltransferase
MWFRALFGVTLILGIVLSLVYGPSMRIWFISFVAGLVVATAGCVSEYWQNVEEDGVKGRTTS